VKREEDRADEEEAGDGVIPAQVFAEIKGDEDAEDDQGDDFLNDFELDGREAVSADAVGRDLEAVLKESNRPTDEDNLPERLVAKAEVTVPGEGHEDVGDGEKDYSPHIVMLDARSVGPVTGIE
jgi:hypothetical protein